MLSGVIFSVFIVFMSFRKEGNREATHRWWQGGMEVKHFTSTRAPLRECDQGVKINRSHITNFLLWIFSASGMFGDFFFYFSRDNYIAVVIFLTEESLTHQCKEPTHAAKYFTATSILALYIYIHKQVVQFT